MATRIVTTSLIIVVGLHGAGCGDEGPSATGHIDVPNVECPPGEDCPDNNTEIGGDDGDLDRSGDDGELTGQPLYWIQAGERTAQAKRKPWSSWWYPLWEDTLFQAKNGEPSPLEKYDTWAARFARQRTTAAAYERTRIYDPRAASWAGLCDAWALAAILEPEPTSAAKHGEVVFSVGDQKALLLKTYENVPALSLVGSRFDGEWDDVYEDVLPHDMHQVVESELFGKQRAFIIDEDAGPEVWNQPVWKVITRVDRDDEDKSVAHVRTWLFLASPHVDDRNFVGTVEDSREYSYDLRGAWKGERFGVRSSEWTDRSQWDHPDYVIVVPDRLKRGSHNPQIRSDLVDRIRGR